MASHYAEWLFWPCAASIRTGKIQLHVVLASHHVVLASHRAAAGMDGAVLEYLARTRPISEPAEGLCVERDALCPAHECDALARCACELVHTVKVA